MVQNDTQVNEQASKKVEFQVKGQVTDHNTENSHLIKREAAVATAQMHNQKSMQIKNSTDQVARTRTVPVKRLEQTSEDRGSQPKEAKACVFRLQEREVEMNVSTQHRANVKATDHINTESTKTTADAKASQMEGGVINRAEKAEGSALMSSHLNAEVSKQQFLHVSLAEGKAKAGSQVEVIRTSVTPVLVGHLSPPIIKLEPLNVKESCDEVQSMEVR